MLFVDRGMPGEDHRRRIESTWKPQTPRPLARAIFSWA
jgi:hypothetical protein